MDWIATIKGTTIQCDDVSRIVHNNIFARFFVAGYGYGVRACGTIPVYNRFRPCPIPVEGVCGTLITTGTV
jgi:hypothetical protein